MARKYPFKWTENSKEDQDARAQLWVGDKKFVNQMISDPMSINLPRYFIDEGMHEKIWSMEPRSDDLWIVTYPKSGTTMGSELLWQLSTGCNVKSEESKEKLGVRAPFLELSCLKDIKNLPPATTNDEGEKEKFERVKLMAKDSIGFVEEASSPRLIKSHLPLSMLPQNLLEVSKVVVFARNVKDVAVSFYHHQKQILSLSGESVESFTFDKYIEYFMTGLPGVYGDYWVHLKDVLKHKQNPNLKIIWFEDLKANFEEKVKELADFTGFEISDEKLKILKDHMNIENFRQNDAVNGLPPPGVVPEDVRKNWNFIRKGKVGGWKESFADEDKLNRFNEWVTQNNKDEEGNIIEGLKFEL